MIEFVVISVIVGFVALTIWIHWLRKNRQANRKLQIDWAKRKDLETAELKEAEETYKKAEAELDARANKEIERLTNDPSELSSRIRDIADAKRRDRGD